MVEITLACSILLAVLGILWLLGRSDRSDPRRQRPPGRRIVPALPPRARNRKKPDWVLRTILRWAALEPQLSHRQLMDRFNRLYAHRGETVGHTWVHGKLRQHRHEILQLR